MVGAAATDAALRDFLTRMNGCLLTLEDVAHSERAAVHRLDAEALMALTEMRRHCHEELQQLEERCRDLMRRHGLAEPLPMEAFIDLYAADTATELKALRRELYQRLLRMEQANEDSRLRLRAANEVIEGVLTHIGIKKPAATYGPGGAR